MIDTLVLAFRRALELPDDLDPRSLGFGGHPHWDSVGHMALIAEVEEAFAVMLDTDDVIGLSSFDAAVDILQRHGVAAAA